MATKLSRFLAAFNDIEQRLRDLTDTDDGLAFGVVLSKALDVSSEARAYQHELRQFATLRNAIVHRPLRGGRPIADPRADAVTRIEEIRRAICLPSSLNGVVARDVFVATMAMPIGDAATRMFDNDFSQLPVLDQGHVTGLLTSQAIARWMTREIIARRQPNLATPVSEVVDCDPESTFVVVDRSATVMRALELFEDYELGGRALHAVILVTNVDGGAVIGIATVADLPRLHLAAAPYVRPSFWAQSGGASKSSAR